MRGGDGAHYYVHGTGGDRVRPSAGTAPNDQHLTATSSAAAARAGSAITGPTHSAGTRRAGATDSVYPGSSITSWEPVDSADPPGDFPSAAAKHFPQLCPTAAPTEADTDSKTAGPSPNGQPLGPGHCAAPVTLSDTETWATVRS